jgi:hypothetical protein
MDWNSTNREGMNRMPMKVAASIPSQTEVPIARRLAAPAPLFRRG